MPSDFAERIDLLKEVVGSGTCSGSVTRDQVYAAYQHERLDLKHPNGGQAKYQEAPLMEKHGDYLQTIADKVLDTGCDAAMAEVMERFALDSGAVTPKELTLLAHSDHPQVTSNGAVVYDRAPEVPRLSDAELRELHPGGHPYGRRGRRG